MRKINPWMALVVGSALALAGCGGDGDDGDSSDVPLTAITADNAAGVSAVVYQAASALFDVASSSGTLPLGAVVQSAPGSAGGLGLASFAARQIKAATRRPPAAGTGVVAAVYEETFQCAGGGSVTERLNDADDNGVESVGDGLRLTFVNCVEEGVTSNGVLGFNLTLVSEASTGAKVTFDNLALNDGTDTIEADGGFNLTVTENTGVSELYEIAGETLGEHAERRPAHDHRLHRISRLRFRGEPPSPIGSRAVSPTAATTSRSTRRRSRRSSRRRRTTSPAAALCAPSALATARPCSRRCL